MTAETALELLRELGLECIGLVAVHTTEPRGGIVWLREDYPEADRRLLLRLELDGTWTECIRLDKKLC
jgi:hypothetical protein